MRRHPGFPKENTMSIRTVSASNGVTWITEAIQLILKNPGPFVLMGLIFTVIGIVPILGSLALAIIGPTLYAGISWAARTQAMGENTEFGHLFQGFKQEGKVGPLLILCLPGIVLGVVLGILATILIVVTMAGAGFSAATDSPAALIGSLGAGAFVLLMVAVVLLVIGFALTFFAIPDVMFRHNDAFAAMKQSARACLANIGAVLMFLLVLVLAALITTLVLSLISGLLAQILVSIAMAPIAGASMYLAWKDVYDESELELPPIDNDEGGGIVA